MPTITRKIELYIDKEGLTDEEYKQKWRSLRLIDDNLHLAATRISSHCFFNDEYEARLKLQMPEYVKIVHKLKPLKKNNLSGEEKSALLVRKKELDKEIKQQKKNFLQTSEQNVTYRLVAKEFGQAIPSDILTNLNQIVVKNYKERQRDIQIGNRVLSTYKKGMPIPFSVTNEEPFKVVGANNENIYLKWYKDICFKLNFGKDRSNNRAIVNRLIESAKQQKKKGEGYVINNSSIQIVEKDHQTKIFLLLSLDIPVEKRDLDKGIVIGIDLGINYPLYLATNQNEHFKQHIGDREHFLNERMVFQRRFKELQRLQCTQGGKGRKKKLEPLERLREKERNWVKSQNHIFSREVIKYALKLGAGTIHLESLKNIGRDEDGNVLDTKSFLLRNWSYHELQIMIEYKAKIEGIDVKYINPAYTSQNCSYCGTRGERKEQAHFKCLNPECTQYEKDINADFNAARNIAMSKNFIERN